MLRHLRISNLAIIDEVEVDFQQGFNVLTGETGAGKSIMIGALDLLLGAKVGPDVIRTGEEEARIEGLFDTSPSVELPEDIRTFSDESGELLLTRRVFSSGRSKCSINGSTATQAMLAAVGRSLVSIFGQHEHHALLNPEEHVGILDRFGGLTEQVERTSSAHQEWKRTVKELKAAKSKLEKLEQEQEANAEAAEELAGADLKENEEDDLLRERELLSKAAQIREHAQGAHGSLYSRSGSILEELAEVRKAVDFLVSVNPDLASIKENLEDATYRLEDVALELRDVAHGAHGDPSALERIDDRIQAIRKLKRKHRTDVPGLLELLGRLNEEAGEILEYRAKVKRLENEVESTRAAYTRTADELSVARREKASELENLMKAELAELAMPHARFHVSIEKVESDSGTASGIDTVEFLLESNPGEAPRPLAKVASGGELSRIMLALKALQLDEEGAGTVIFDEVDAGIGGNTAVAVGTRLTRVARRQQVLCITHLHQIAALADNHVQVTKMVRKGRTRIQVTALDEEGRVGELTRMLGASPRSRSAQDHVRSLMESSRAEVTG